MKAEEIKEVLETQTGISIAELNERHRAALASYSSCACHGCGFSRLIAKVGPDTMRALAATPGVLELGTRAMSAAAGAYDQEPKQ